jgi:hypothetical protein
MRLESEFANISRNVSLKNSINDRDVRCRKSSPYAYNGTPLSVNPTNFPAHARRCCGAVSTIDAESK